MPPRPPSTPRTPEPTTASRNASEEIVNEGESNFAYILGYKALLQLQIAKAYIVILIYP